MKGDRMAKRSSFGTIVRKRLSDVTNTLPQPKSPELLEKLSPNPKACSAKEYIERLHKDNTALMKLIADKNKIIEASGLELQKLRINLQKMQLQNWNLAQTNSHMLAELNLGREKLKALHHEIGCKDALLKVKNLELKGQRTKNGEKNELKGGDVQAIVQHKCIADSNTRKRRPVRSQSMGPSTTFQQAAEKETVENKRRCLRRQSARFKSHEPEASESLFEIKDLKLDIPTSEDDSSLSQSSSIVEKERTERSIRSRPEQPQGSQRTSLGRPSRRAAEKVQSYKEIPLNLKMRRIE